MTITICANTAPGPDPQIPQNPAPVPGIIFGVGQEYPAGLSDIEAEAALLGSMILDNTRDYVPLVLDLIKNELYFSKSEHRHIFNAIITLYKNGSAVDLVLVKSELERQQRLTAAGGVDYLIQVAQSTPTVANAVFYARKVLEKYKQRLGWDLTQRQRAILINGSGRQDIQEQLRQAVLTACR